MPGPALDPEDGYKPRLSTLRELTVSDHNSHICSLLFERCLYTVCQILRDPHSVPAPVLGVQ